MNNNGVWSGLMSMPRKTGDETMIAPTIPRKMPTPRRQPRRRLVAPAAFQEPLPSADQQTDEPEQQTDTNAVDYEQFSATQIGRLADKASRQTTTDSQEITRPTEHNGVKILREELVRNLPRAPFRFVRLHLEDGNTAWACRDCAATRDTRGAIMVHRNEDHGVDLGGNRRRGTTALKATPDPILPPREDGTPSPSDPMRWTIGELLAVAPDLAALGDSLQRLEDENENLLEEINTLRQRQRQNEQRENVWDVIQGELVDARMKLQAQPDYDEIKKEVVELRAWKKNMVKKLGALGFQLSEEE